MSPKRRPFATHAIPSPGITATPCCGLPVNDLPRYHIVTPDLDTVTCNARRANPLTVLIAITLTSTQRPGPRRAFLAHGDEDGHIYDERCALCAGDYRTLARHLSEALTAAFPHADIRNLRARPPLRSRTAPDPHRNPLRALLEALLTTTPRTAVGTVAVLPAHRHPDDRDPRCALCSADVDALATATTAALARALPSALLPAPTLRPAPEGAP